MTERHRLSLEVADQIRKSILEHQEYFFPHTFEDAIIVGGIRKNGHSDHDIDIALLWQSGLSCDLKQKTLRHLITWLRENYGELIDYLDLYSYVPHKSTCFTGREVGFKRAHASP